VQWSDTTELSEVVAMFKEVASFLAAATEVGCEMGHWDSRVGGLGARGGAAAWLGCDRVGWGEVGLVWGGLGCELGS
jgi:hypothetical protein